LNFFAEEYQLNRKIKRFPKPYIAIYNGIVMGGGVGVSVHGSYRIATDATTLAMPETGIGFFPDVGGTYFMPRLRGGLGNYMALTGARLNGGDCVAEGLADFYMPVSKIDSLLSALAETDDIDATLARMSVAPPIGKLSADREAIDHCFKQATVDEVIKVLEVTDTDWANLQLKIIRQKSPLSIAVTWEQLRRGATLSFEDCLRLEYRIALASCQTGEFREGVRALLVDKDNQPKWQHNRIEDVSAADILFHFEEPKSGDMSF
jgi:enoyl-CoA hydratase